MMTNPINLANWLLNPFNRQSFSRVEDVLPVETIAHDPRATVPLECSLADYGSFAFKDRRGREWGLDRFIASTLTDALLIMRDGRVTFEWYAPGYSAQDRHIVFSVTKSVIGLLAGVLVSRGNLDPDSPVRAYVPEISGSGFDDASVRNVLDMTASLDIPEDSLNPDSLFNRYRRAVGWAEPRPNEDECDTGRFLAMIGSNRSPPGSRFEYSSPCADLLGWICARAGGERPTVLLSELVWKPLGAQRDALITLDRSGFPRAAGGLACTLRDAARIGECMRLGGQLSGKMVVPQEWVDDVRTHGDRAAWAAGSMADVVPGGCYRNQWWITNDEDGCYFASASTGNGFWFCRSSAP
jgi:CubicO group peptidase (beta-lactamase class C family)